MSDFYLFGPTDQYLYIYTSITTKLTITYDRIRCIEYKSFSLVNKKETKKKRYFISIVCILFSAQSSRLGAVDPIRP